jgi:hypothetical protein
MNTNSKDLNPTQSKASRRGVLWGLLGASAVTAVALGHQSSEPAIAMATENTPPPPERGGGYHLSDHVKRYFHSTRV